MHHSTDSDYNHYRTERSHKGRASGLGTILLIIGIIWLLKETGWQFHLHGGEFGNIIAGFASFLGAIAWIVSIPVILLIVGILLITGRKVLGTILVILGILFLLNNLIIPGFVMILFSPIVLIIIGVLLLIKLL